jgi:hypothetical protein
VSRKAVDLVCLLKNCFTTLKFQSLDVIGQTATLKLKVFKIVSNFYLIWPKRLCELLPSFYVCWHCCCYLITFLWCPRKLIGILELDFAGMMFEFLYKHIFFFYLFRHCRCDVYEVLYKLFLFRHLAKKQEPMGSSSLKLQVKMVRNFV